MRPGPVTVTLPGISLLYGRERRRRRTRIERHARWVAVGIVPRPHAQVEALPHEVEPHLGLCAVGADGYVVVGEGRPHLRPCAGVAQTLPHENAVGRVHLRVADFKLRVDGKLVGVRPQGGSTTPSPAGLW